MVRLIEVKIAANTGHVWGWRRARKAKVRERELSVHASHREGESASGLPGFS